MIITILNSCQKSINNSNNFIRGRLFLVDTITQNSIGKPIANARVRLSTINDSLNFIYSVNTDNEGYFNFTLISGSDKEYNVSIDTIIKNYSYIGRSKVQAGDDNVVLSLQLNETNQNGLILFARDNLGNPLPKSIFSIYTSESLALLDNKLGAFAEMESDENGKAFKISIPKGKY